ncbi:Endothelin-converting enzyme 1 OS=Tsukamurella paurometabola (strain ATCC 8368 / DSM / CCUG 35730 / CIP 100753 / JCM 10117 / KCTC 9821 / NBRC 16120 / NCIMB 702349 / NCTC 13040) OX=521096 GN=Tpau_2915 PE=4 SV=1 [Tsukamurella paurometabola]|uniref:Endothelin-converting enzyme 1 n=1 Tax=Tsukamurella paurometabola (strain ATCC 8368 / DSM 20162 / CCUG 35730 / CIP 100753 / JCM 10117 / KCTC 9821 / NBRC 16120 / NCIMB 702349 / NCTC 13040) TaxID=521096 RepID=D5UU10_TSUPD|nr:M13 family metallopeptidase [Tsukamurella paurometabola]ADG79513.1 Endothelin-converting enzyme 1 [Tsukamurella paurometabola DSM 20162]SUP36040.1 Neutral endopeptidase [Tsukamurella paurometabola]
MQEDDSRTGRRDTTGRPKGGVDRRRFLLGLGTVAGAGVLAACGGTGTPGGPSTTRRPYSSLTGPDMSGAAPGVRVQDDLFRHVNGAWYDSFQIPPEKPSGGGMETLTDQVEKQLREIIESIRDAKAGSDEAKIRDTYRTFMDTAKIDAVGTAPLRSTLSAIDGAADRAALFDVVGAQQRTDGGWGVVGVSVSPDRKNSTRNLVHLTPTMGGLPSKAHYLDAQMQDVRDKYREFMRKTAELAGFADPAGTADRVIAVETNLARATWEREKYRDDNATYNLYQWTQLADLAPGFDWLRWRDLQGLTSETSKEVVVMQPDFLPAAATIWAKTDIEALKDCARMGIISTYADVLPQAFGDARFEFYERTLDGAQKQEERWKMGVTMVNTTLGEALGRLYVQKHFSAESKRQVEKLVENLKSAYRSAFERSQWMSPPTRTAAIAKLDKMTTKLGYPDKWEDYSTLEVGTSSAVENTRAVIAYTEQMTLDQLTKPVDRSKWNMLPQSVNASYVPTSNEICFPAAILQAPFFSVDNQAAVNYGAIGAVIGHEIGHAFDDSGSKYDGDGNLKDWWAPADRAEFDKRTKALIAQYNTLVPIGAAPGSTVNGAMTVGENLADLGGLGIAVEAFRLAVKNRDAGTEFADQSGSATPSASGPQAENAALVPLFLSYARSWQNKTRPEAVRESLATAMHAPPEFRTNQVVKNVDTFADTFGVRPGDGEWLEPKDRVRLW